MNLSITIKTGTLAGRVFQLSEGFLTIGRSETCSIRFDQATERIASKQHAFIEAKAGGFYLSDNNSTNGTFLNGQKIQSTRLNSGDVIQFGQNGIEGTVFIEARANQSQVTVLKPGLQPTVSYQPVQAAPVAPVFYDEPLNLKNSFSGFSASHPVEPARERKAGKYIGIAAAIFAVVFF